jgi:hypothetical protein
VQPYSSTSDLAFQSCAREVYRPAPASGMPVSCLGTRVHRQSRLVWGLNVPSQKVCQAPELMSPLKPSSHLEIHKSPGWPPALRLAREAEAAEVDCSVVLLDEIPAEFLGVGAVRPRAQAQGQAGAHMAVEYLKRMEAEHQRKIRNLDLGPEVKR